ncbi:stalk domain-containing protein (plasmid) [Brevibacillus halotolerans]|nr:stalk domain-containing protein [Brevibacillus halotolerans]
MKRLAKPVIMAVLATSMIATSAMPAFAKAYKYEDDFEVDLGSYIAGEKSSVFLELDMKKAKLIKGEMIKIKFPQGWDLPNRIDEEDVEINGEEVKNVKVSGRTVKIEIPKKVHGEDELEIKFLKRAGLSNPTNEDRNYRIEVSLQVAEEHKEKKVTKVPKPVKPTVPSIEPAKPVETTAPSVEPIKPVETTVPSVEPIKPVETTVPSVEPTKPVETTVPSVEPTKPVGTTAPSVEPAQPTKPTGATDPTKPVIYETITEEVTVTKIVDREYESEKIKIKKDTSKKSSTSKKSNSTSIVVPAYVTKKLEVSLQVGSTTGSQFYSENGIVGSNNVVILDTAPFIRKGTTLVPLRFIADGLGVPIVYDNSTHTAILTLNEKTVKLVPGSKTAKIDNDTVNLSVAPELVNNRMMVPLRFIAENLGAKVDWDQSTKTININKTSIHTK